MKWITNSVKEPIILWIKSPKIPKTSISMPLVFWCLASYYLKQMFRFLFTGHQMWSLTGVERQTVCVGPLKSKLQYLRDLK